MTILGFLANNALTVGTGLAVLALLIVASSTWIIRENESGLVIKKYGPPLAAGRLVALDGEAGYQARMLPPGWHFVSFRWQYSVVKVPTVVVPPGQIALVVAADGASIPTERMLGREVPCDNFQDAEAFLRGGGERGRQLGFLTAGTYRINPALFQLVTTRNAEHHGMVEPDLCVKQIPADTVGIVTTLDGRPIAAGDLAGPPVKGHDSYQRGQRFIEAGGCRGLQEEVLLAGSWNLNPWFVQVELTPMLQIPIGQVGVVVSYVGKEHVDVSGESFKHGDLVERGGKGVWVEPLLPGKHPLNLRVMKVEPVPTTNIVLNWAERTEAHSYDNNLSSILVRSKDGFSFSLDVAQVIHIGAKMAPRVISRVGSMQNLVDHVLQPTVGNYFRNSAQEVTVLEFLSARSERQRQAKDAIRHALDAYDVECIDTLIGDIVPPAELMKTQTDRKIADELKRTYDVQRESQEKRQQLERERAVADLQAEVVRSEQMVRIAEQNAHAAAEKAKGEAAATRLRADAEADATRALGSARAEAYREGQAAIGPAAYSAMQIATIVGERHIKIVPDISAGGGGGGLAEALIARMLRGEVASGTSASGTVVNGTGVSGASGNGGAPQG
jgi:uncharacterized membrane protein YqiK